MDENGSGREDIAKAMGGASGLRNGMQRVRKWMAILLHDT